MQIEMLSISEVILEIFKKQDVRIQELEAIITQLQQTPNKLYMLDFMDDNTVYVPKSMTRWDYWGMDMYRRSNTSP